MQLYIFVCASNSRTLKMSKLSLQNAILTYEQLETTPSKKDNIPEELEDELRRLGCDFIQSAGIVLRL